jgi:hypothetical protein
MYLLGKLLLSVVVAITCVGPLDAHACHASSCWALRNVETSPRLETRYFSHVVSLLYIITKCSLSQQLLIIMQQCVVIVFWMNCLELYYKIIFRYHLKKYN